MHALSGDTCCALTECLTVVIMVHSSGHVLIDFLTVLMCGIVPVVTQCTGRNVTIVCVVT